MKLLFFILISITCIQQLSAQVTGRLAAADSQPIPFATVRLSRANDTVTLKAVRTDSTGVFVLPAVAAGRYQLKYSSIGFMPASSDVFELTASRTNIDLGLQQMQPANRQLEGVVVRAQKRLFQQKPEGMVVNVENSLLTKGSSALQVLERLPGVVINYRDNSIALNGKNGVMVMMNGKLVRMPMEQLVALLNSINADDIASIELLTTPPAKYDAEGSAGLINIVTKKNKKQGTTGSLSLTAGYGKAEKGSASISLSHNTARINWSGTYSFSHNRTYSDMYIESSQQMPFLGGDVSMSGWFNTKALSNNHDASLAMDLKANKKTTIGASINFNTSALSGSNVTAAGYNVLPDSLLQFNSINKGADRWNNLVNSVYLEKAIKEGEKLNISADWLYFNNKDAYAVQSSFTNNQGKQAGDQQVLFGPEQKGVSNTDIRVGVGKIDYEKQWNTKIKMETGLKGAFTQSTSLSGIQSLVNGVWTNSDQTSNYVRMKEGIGAAYFSMNAKLSESASLTAGLRYEYSSTNMNNAVTGETVVNRKLGVLFPSIFFSKKVGDNSEWQLSYTKRISRPSYKDLASYVGYSDPTAVYTGNPFLQPTITNNIKIGYSYKNYAFSLLFSRDDNAIARYQLTESPNHDILYISPQNLGWQNNITLQATVPVTVNNWWSMSYSFAGGPRQYKVSYAKTPFQYSWFGYSVNTTQTFKLPNHFSAEISGWYNNTSYNGTQYIKGFGALNAGIKKELGNNAGSFQLSVTDILGGQHYDIEYGRITREAFNIRSHVFVKPETTMFPIIKLTYTKSLGSVLKQPAKKAAAAQDERNRINN